MISNRFVHLRNYTSYSLAEGAIKIDDLVVLALKNKMPSIAITDKGNLFGSLEFSKSCTNNGIKPIIGVTLKIDIDSDKITKSKILDEIVLFAKNKTGYDNLIKIVSHSFLDNKSSTPHSNLEIIEKYSKNIIALSGGIHGPINRLVLESDINGAQEVLIKLNQIFLDNFYIELSRHNLEEEEKTEKSLIDFAYKYNVPLVATNHVYFKNINMYEAHDTLLCIASGRYVSEEDRKKSNTEYYFKSEREMRNLFSDIPEAINNTSLIARRCSVKSEEHLPMLPNFAVFSGISEIDEFKNNANEGLINKFKILVSNDIDGELFDKYKERLNYEIDVITKMDFPGYFLIVSDFIRWSKKNNIPVGPGRGSGAGSLVAWALDITDIDPIKFNLLFERFLNPERVSMPDFDIDFCQERRDEVISYVREKYGKEKVAQIITFGKLQAKAVIRDVGRVLQMPYGQVDRISKMVPFNAVNPVTLSQAIDMEPALRKVRDEDEQVAKLLSIALQLEGLNRHTSTHAAGIIIAKENLIDFTPICSDLKSDMLVTQYSMKYAEMSGLVKFDFLGLKTLTTIANTCKLINNNDFDIRKISISDSSTFELLSQGITIGVFQFESPGMQDALRKMKPDVFEDLIALGALYRPGPMDNIPTYIACKHGIDQPNYLHPTLEPVLKETFGVIIYQEQVMEIAQILAGYTLGSADLLRRAMGKKIKSEMDAQRVMFVDGAISRGVDKTHASSIFDLVAKFAGYGFNKSHAAAYAMISYQTAYLKANYPVEFIVASLNLDIHDTDKISIFIEESKKLNIKILPPDINKSIEIFNIDNEAKSIRYALGALKGVGIAAMSQIVLERSKNGLFKDITDFIERIDNKILNKRQLEHLIKSGAFDSIHKNRKQLVESIDIMLKFNNNINNVKNVNQINLFNNIEKKQSINLSDTDDYIKSEKLRYECDSIGFYLTDHPIDDISDILDLFNVRNFNYIRNIKINGSSNITIAAVTMVTKTRSSPRGRYVQAQMSDPTGIFNIGIYNDDILASARDLLASRDPLLINVEVRKDDGGTRITAQSIISLDRYLSSKKIDLSIYLSDVSNINYIKSMLAKNNNNYNSKITIIVKKDDNEVEIDLGSRFHLSTEELSLLKCEKSIDKLIIN